RQEYPQVLCCGEFLYAALLEFIPLYHVYSPHGVPYARFFSHLSAPAPGRGSSGVHEPAFGRCNTETLGLSQREGLIPTLMVVDDTFTKYRDQMAAVIAKAKAWPPAGSARRVAPNHPQSEHRGDLVAALRFEPHGNLA